MDRKLSRAPPHPTHTHCYDLDRADPPGDRGTGEGSWDGPPHLRLPLLVHPVDLAPHEHSDPAFAPSLLAAKEVGDEEGEAW